MKKYKLTIIKKQFINMSHSYNQAIQYWRELGGKQEHNSLNILWGTETIATEFILTHNVQDGYIKLTKIKD